MKNIYEAEIVYYINFFKKRFLLINTEYEGEVSIPLPKYILAFSEKNAKDKVIYSKFWKYNFAKEKMWECYRVNKFEVEKKFVRVKIIKNRDLKHLIENMNKKDFLEWINMEECGYA